MRLSLFNRLLIGTMLLLSIVACTEELPFNEVPQITLLAYGPDTVVEFKDSIYFSISYEDGDGDLGENNIDDHNLIVTDTRIGIDYEFRIKQLVPNNAAVPIKGVLNFSIPNTFITNSSLQQLVRYSIFVQDRANHKSNTLETDDILIIQ